MIFATENSYVGTQIFPLYTNFKKKCINYQGIDVENRSPQFSTKKSPSFDLKFLSGRGRENVAQRFLKN